MMPFRYQVDCDPPSRFSFPFWFCCYHWNEFSSPPTSSLSWNVFSLSVCNGERDDERHFFFSRLWWRIHDLILLAKEEEEKVLLSGQQLESMSSVSCVVLLDTSSRMTSFLSRRIFAGFLPSLFSERNWLSICLALRAVGVEKDEQRVTLPFHHHLWPPKLSLCRFCVSMCHTYNAYKLCQ